MKNPVRCVLPIITVNFDSDPRPVTFEGTAFLIKPNIIMTCWHCVKNELPPNHKYAVLQINKEMKFTVSDLEDLEKDSRGYDLALARCDFTPEVEISLSEDEYWAGQQVYSFGYPDTELRDRDDGAIEVNLTARYFQSYVMRLFNYQVNEHPITKSYELAMAAPEGLSGAPLLKHGTNELLGVVYGNIDVQKITQFKKVDPDTGDEEPEIQRIISYGLAHHLDVISELSGKATNNRTIRELFSK